MAGYTYILECNDGSYYVGSTRYLVTRYHQHELGEGANHTRKHPPVALLYYEKYFGVDVAFKREKQIQGWSRVKKEALMTGRIGELKLLSECQNMSHCKHRKLRELAIEDRDMIDPNEGKNRSPSALF